MSRLPFARVAIDVACLFTFFNSRVAWRMRCRTRLAEFIFGYVHIYALHVAETRHPSRKRATCTCGLPGITCSKQHTRVVGNGGIPTDDGKLQQTCVRGRGRGRIGGREQGEESESETETEKETETETETKDSRGGSKREC